MDAGPRLPGIPRPVAANPHARREATHRTLGSRRCTDRQGRLRQARRRRKQGARDDDDACCRAGVSPETGGRWARRLPLFPARAAPGPGRVRHERGDQAAAFDDRPPRDPLRSVGRRTPSTRGDSTTPRAATAGPASAARACPRRIRLPIRPRTTGWAHRPGSAPGSRATRRTTRRPEPVCSFMPAPRS